MPRTLLTDEHWSKLLPILNEHRIYNKSNLRLTVEGILYRLRVGCPWRDLPEYFGCWNRVYKRFNDWSRQEKLMNIFRRLCHEPDMEWQFIDGSVVKAHQHSSGAVKTEETAIGKSVAGNSSKIHLAVESGGLPIEFTVTGGEVNDIKEAPELVALLPVSDYKIADRGYDSEPLREQVRQQGSIPIIPRKKTRKWVMMISTGACTNIDTWSKTLLQDLSTLELLLLATTSSSEILWRRSLSLAPLYGCQCEPSRF